MSKKDIHLYTKEEVFIRVQNANEYLDMELLKERLRDYETTTWEEMKPGEFFRWIDITNPVTADVKGATYVRHQVAKIDNKLRIIYRNVYSPKKSYYNLIYENCILFKKKENKNNMISDADIFRLFEELEKSNMV